jgi:hypothetical protein
MAAVAVILTTALSCARSYPDAATPSLVVPGAAIAAPGALKQAAGCWRLRFPDWTVPFLPDSALLFLDTATVRGQSPNAAYVARVVASSPPQDSIGAEWALFGPGDSVHIVLGRPANGVRMRLGHARDTLSGVGRTWDNTLDNIRSGSIAGGRASCVTRPPQN